MMNTKQKVVVVGGIMAGLAAIALARRSGAEPPAPVYGCTDPQASNYNPAATVDDGSCEYPPPPPQAPITRWYFMYKDTGIYCRTYAANPVTGVELSGEHQLCYEHLGHPLYCEILPARYDFLYCGFAWSDDKILTVTRGILTDIGWVHGPPSIIPFGEFCQKLFNGKPANSFLKENDPEYIRLRDRGDGKVEYYNRMTDGNISGGVFNDRQVGIAAILNILQGSKVITQAQRDCGIYQGQLYGWW